LKEWIKKLDNSVKPEKKQLESIENEEEEEPEQNTFKRVLLSMLGITVMEYCKSLAMSTQYGTPVPSA
jgi:hypothetical protein